MLAALQVQTFVKVALQVVPASVVQPFVQVVAWAFVVVVLQVVANGEAQYVAQVVAWAVVLAVQPFVPEVLKVVDAAALLFVLAVAVLHVAPVNFAPVP